MHRMGDTKQWFGLTPPANCDKIMGVNMQTGPACGFGLNLKSHTVLVCRISWSVGELVCRISWSVFELICRIHLSVSEPDQNT